MKANLKKTSLAVALAGVFVSSAVFAQTRPAPVDDGQGTVKIYGQLVDTTCKINTGDDNKEVDLGIVNTSSLKTPGNTGDATYFTLGVNDCGGGVTKVRANFEPDNMDPSATGDAMGTYLNLFAKATGDASDATAATGVNIQMLNGNGTVVVANGVSNQQWFDIDSTANTATMQYGARFYAVAKATSGYVRTYVKYTLVYQ